MSLWSALGLKKSDEQKQAEAADAAKVASDQQNAITISNYRLNSKNQYDRLKNNRYAPYAGLNAYAQGAHIPGMSAPQPSVVSLADTGAGAPVGSNAAGWDDKSWDGQYLPGGARTTGTVTHHTGYNEYLNGTAQAPGSQIAARDNWNTGDAAGTQRYSGHTVDAVEGGLPQEVQPVFMPGGGAPPPPGSTATPAPGTQYKFFPGGR